MTILYHVSSLPSQPHRDALNESSFKLAQRIALNSKINFILLTFKNISQFCLHPIFPQLLPLNVLEKKLTR